MNDTAKIDDRRRITTLVLHALFIGIIFVLPEALLRVAIPDRTLDITWPMYAKSGITIAVFYINYFLIIPRTLFGKRTRRIQFIIWNIALVAAASFAVWAIYRLLYHGPHRFALQQSSLAAISYIIRDAIMLILAVALAFALRVSQRWFDLRQHHRSLLAMRQQVELASLRSQLNPHFLFNILNTIYVLIEVSPADAQRAVHRLSALLRYVIYENPRVVALDREIDFVTNYVELMRLRMPDRPVELDIRRADDLNTRVAPLIFVAQVENAFKHGNTPDQSEPIRITIRSDNNTIECATENSFVESHSGDDSHGIGLANLRRRIELLYGGANASLQCGPDLRDPHIYRTLLTIPANQPQQ